ncbi:MAG: hypothetical protein FJX77_09570 [Armatimonadetes bacterium]|nr:hypothetical protein [Armatimonadota bacterium]
MMTAKWIRPVRLMVAGLCVAGVLAVTVGCGAEKQNVTPNENPTAVPGGASQQDYQGGMNRVLQQQQGK